jgi:hypothetical protein
VRFCNTQTDTVFLRNSVLERGTSSAHGSAISEDRSGGRRSSDREGAVHESEDIWHPSVQRHKFRVRFDKPTLFVTKLLLGQVTIHLHCLWLNCCKEKSVRSMSKLSVTLKGGNRGVYVMCDWPSITGARCWWRSWWRHCATSRKVAGSIPDGVIGIFHWHNSSGRTMALGLTQSGGKGGQCVGLTTLPLSCADYLEFWEPQPPGTLWACPGLYCDWFASSPVSKKIKNLHIVGD